MLRPDQVSYHSVLAVPLINFCLLCNEPKIVHINEDLGFTIIKCIYRKGYICLQCFARFPTAKIHGLDYNLWPYLQMHVNAADSSSTLRLQAHHSLFTGTVYDCYASL